MLENRRRKKKREIESGKRSNSFVDGTIFDAKQFRLVTSQKKIARVE